MGNSIASLLLIDKLRKYLRYIKKNIYNSIAVVAFGILFLGSIGSLIEVGLREYFPIISIVFLVYCIAKVFENSPTITIDCRLLELRILKLWQFKLLILLKSAALSVAILIMSMIFNVFYIVSPKNIIILCIINIIINLICFFRTQTKLNTLITTITLLIVGLSYYFNSIFLIFIYLIICLICLIKQKPIKYDNILGFYKSMAVIKDGLLSNNVNRLMEGQATIRKDQINSNMSLIEKFYNKDKMFEFYKEISRALCNYKRIINISIINFFIGLLVSMNNDLLMINSIALLGVIVISEQILSSLNSSEKMIIRQGFYYPYSLKQIIINKYLAHVLIIFVPIMSSAFIFNKITFIGMILCTLIIPIKNIISNYSDKFLLKVVSYLLECILLTLCFINNI